MLPGGSSNIGPTQPTLRHPGWQEGVRPELGCRFGFFAVLEGSDGGRRGILELGRVP